MPLLRCSGSGNRILPVRRARKGKGFVLVHRHGAKNRVHRVSKDIGISPETQADRERPCAKTKRSVVAQRKKETKKMPFRLEMTRKEAKGDSVQIAGRLAEYEHLIKQMRKWQVQAHALAFPAASVVNSAKYEGFHQLN